MADPVFKVLVVGAGHVGPAVATLLNETGDFSIVLADATEEGIRHAEALGFRAREFDAVRPADADRLLPEFDLVVGATPQWALSYLGPMAVKHGVAYIDLAEDSAALAPLASAIRAPTIPCCGFSPGLQNDLANHLVHRFDQAHALQVRVGAIPAQRTNRLGYALIWDVDALVNEHIRPVTSIVDGQVVEREPLSDYEMLEIGGTTLESFTTSGGSRALCTRFTGQLDRVDMKSIRYPGYYELMRFLLDDLQLRARPHQLASLLRNGLPEAGNDVLFSAISASGIIDGKPAELWETHRIESLTLANGTTIGALSRAAAAHVCAIADLIRLHEPETAGLVDHMNIPFEKLASNRFLAGLFPASAADASRSQRARPSTV